MAATMFTPFEPKATNRFIMYIGNPKIESYLIKASGTPTYDTGEIVIDYINVDFKVKSKTRWNDITITLYDPIDPQGADMVHEWLLKMHTSGPASGGPGGVDGYAFDDYKQDIDLKYVDPKGDEGIMKNWKITGAFPSAVNWGSFDWAQGDAMMIEVTLKYDYAELI